MKTLKAKTLITLMAIITLGIASNNLHNNESVEIKTDKTDKAKIKSVVNTYVLGGDQQSVSQLESVMHDNYRVIINDLNEGIIKELDKSTYLGFIEKKAFGGEERKIEIESISISNEVNSIVVLKMTSNKAIFHSQFSLVKVDSKWWIIQDLVQMEIK